MRVVGNAPSGGKKPSTPTIGTATAGDSSATVAYTASTYAGKGGAVTYTATSSPGSKTGTGASPITVSGLTNGTAYTFTVQASTSYGVSSDASAASNSVTPVTPSSFESIATATGTGSSGTITFSSIPQTYTALQLRFLSIDDNGGALISLVPNSYVGNGGANHYLRGTGSSTTATATAGSGNGAYWLSYSPYSSTTYPVVGIVDIFDYTSTTRVKTVRTFSGLDVNNSPGWVQLASAAIFDTTAAITTLDFKLNIGNFTTSTVVALYGIKG